MLFWCYTQPATAFFRCEWTKLADTLQLPDWKADKICAGKTFPGPRQYKAAITALAGGLDNALDLQWLYMSEKGVPETTDAVAPSWSGEDGVLDIPLTPPRLRAHILDMPQNGEGALRVEILVYDLVARYGTKNAVFAAYVDAHHRGYLRQPFRQTPCETERKPATVIGLTFAESLVGSLVLLVGAIVLLVVAITADSPSGKITPAIIGTICVLLAPTVVPDLVAHIRGFFDNRQPGLASERQPCSEFGMPPQPGVLGELRT